VIVLELHDVAVRAWLDSQRAVRRGGARLELAGLGHGTACELPAADAGREAEVVLDAPRRAGLAPQGRALDHERIEALRGAVDRRAQAGGAGADHDEVDLLA